MRVRYFLLGAVFGVAATVIGLAVLLVVMLTRPVPEAAEPPGSSGSDVVVSVGEGYINSVATDLARSQGFAVERLTVDLQPERRIDTLVDTQVSIIGLKTDVQVRLVGLVQLENGHLTVAVRTLEFAGIGVSLAVLPESLRLAIEDMETTANNEMSKALEQSGLVPVGVVTDESAITVALRTR